jgi:phage anti-repressor protein
MMQSNEIFGSNPNNVPLIRVEQKNGNNVVSARELYQFLQVQTDFTDWCKRMFEYGFIENQDFAILLKNGENKISKSNPIDYALTLDTAKEIAMIQRTEKGKQARQYFIECEKKLSEGKSSIDLIIESAIRLKHHEEQIKAIESKQREAEAYMEQVEAEPIRTMHVTVRKALDALVKNYAVAKGVDVPKVYGLLYSQFDMRYKKNTRLNSKRQSLSMITWVEQNGWIAELYEVAKDIFSQPNKV